MNNRTKKSRAGIWRLVAIALPTILTLFFVAMTAFPALAQSLNLDLGDGPNGGTTGRIIQLVALMTVLSLAPGILVMVTSFTRVVIVLSLLRQPTSIERVQADLFVPNELAPIAPNFRRWRTTVTVQADTLFAQLEGQQAVPVFETAPDRFEFDVVKAVLIFTRDDKKQINGLTLLQNGMTVHAPRIKSPTSGPKP